MVPVGLKNSSWPEPAAQSLTMARPAGRCRTAKIRWSGQPEHPEKQNRRACVRRPALKEDDLRMDVEEKLSVKGSGRQSTLVGEIYPKTEREKSGIGYGRFTVSAREISRISFKFRL